MKRLTILIFLILATCLQAFADPTPAEKKFYRDMILKTRTKVEFKVAMPANGDMHFNYQLKFAEPKWPAPITNDFPITNGGLKPTGKFIRNFWDKIFLTDDSYLEVGGEQIPLTCIHVSGQDNRYSGKTGPQFPDFILKIIFVTNDWTCTGPLNPGWPGNGGKKEAWETYVHYTIKDPTIMLPMDAELRFRWSEFDAVLVQ